MNEAQENNLVADDTVFDVEVSHEIRDAFFKRLEEVVWPQYKGCLKGKNLSDSVSRNTVFNYFAIKTAKALATVLGENNRLIQNKEKTIEYIEAELRSNIKKLTDGGAESLADYPITDIYSTLETADLYSLVITTKAVKSDTPSVIAEIRRVSGVDA